VFYVKKSNKTSLMLTITRYHRANLTPLHLHPATRHNRLRGGVPGNGCAAVRAENADNAHTRGGGNGQTGNERIRVDKGGLGFAVG
jgi:hypothetical protein